MDSRPIRGRICLRPNTGVTVLSPCLITIYMEVAELVVKQCSGLQIRRPTSRSGRALAHALFSSPPLSWLNWTHLEPNCDPSVMTELTALAFRTECETRWPHLFDRNKPVPLKPDTLWEIRDLFAAEGMTIGEGDFWRVYTDWNYRIEYCRACCKGSVLTGLDGTTQPISREQKFLCGRRIAKVKLRARRKAKALAEADKPGSEHRVCTPGTDNQQCDSLS